MSQRKGILSCLTSMRTTGRVVKLYLDDCDEIYSIEKWGIINVPQLL
jgi:hypothetical protein